MALAIRHWDYQSHPHRPTLCHGNIEGVSEDAAEFAQSTGLDISDVVVSSLVGFPLPLVYDEEGNEVDRRQRWAGVHPKLLWHPFFWLPDEVAYPVVLTYGDEDNVFIEDIDGWAFRVLMTLSRSQPIEHEGTWYVPTYEYHGHPITLHRTDIRGDLLIREDEFDPANMDLVRRARRTDSSLINLYDPAKGWVDVLYMHGIDIKTPAGLERVKAWQDGADDEVLDAIDLTPHLFARGRDPLWPLYLLLRKIDTSAHEGMPEFDTYGDLLLRAAHMNAGSDIHIRGLVPLANELASGDTDFANVEEAIEEARALFDVTFEFVPEVSPDTGIDTIANLSGRAVSELELSSTMADVAAVVISMSNIVEGVIETFEPALTVLDMVNDETNLELVTAIFLLNESDEQQPTPPQRKEEQQ